MHQPAALCGYNTATRTIKIELEVSSRGHDLINVMCWRDKVDQYFDGATLERCFAEPHFTIYTKPLGILDNQLHTHFDHTDAVAFCGFKTIKTYLLDKEQQVKL